MDDLIEKLMEEYDLNPSQIEKLQYFSDCIDGMSLDDSDMEHILKSAIESFLEDIEE